MLSFRITMENSYKYNKGDVIIKIDNKSMILFIQKLPVILMDNMSLKTNKLKKKRNVRKKA